MPVDQRALATSLETLGAAGLDGDRRPLAERLDEVMTAARDMIHVDGVGLMLLDDAGALRLAGASTPAGMALERAQLRLNCGPGIDCVRENETVAVADLAAADDYAPVWADLERGEEPVRAVLSVPVQVAGSVVGTLNVLRTEPQAWDFDSVRAAEAYAELISVLLRLGATAQE
ncbi:GAF domain-containing protein [Actinoplanes sp. NPDC049596]|uniref:GAF domain-containing protein n=1 Tax=unclassified Actinoplanes TaxID=2626549 RepID=UPI003422B186